jgi:hypothetical protein
MQMSAQPVNGAGVELSALDLRASANEGFWLQLLSPWTHEPVPARLRLLGADADACRLKYRTLRRIRATVILGRALDEEQVAAELDLVEAATVGWEGLKVNGEEYAFSPEHVRELYARWPWVIDLAQEAIANRANFSRSSGGS